MESQILNKEPEKFIRPESLAGLHPPEALSLKLSFLSKEDKKLIDFECNKKSLPDLDYMIQTFNYFDIVDENQREPFTSYIGDIKMNVGKEGKQKAVNELVKLIAD